MVIIVVFLLFEPR